MTAYDDYRCLALHAGLGDASKLADEASRALAEIDKLRRFRDHVAQAIFTAPVPQGEDD